MPRVRKPKTESKDAPKTESAVASEVVVEGLAVVVSLEDKKAKKAKKAKSTKSADNKLAEFYKKYSHVVKDSVREVAKGEEIERGDLLPPLVSKGKLCTVECVDCQTTFEVNLQDAFQSKRCPKCKRAASKDRRSNRRKARASKAS
jgi:hypothetical protein